MPKSPDQKQASQNNIESRATVSDMAELNEEQVVPIVPVEALIPDIKSQNTEATKERGSLSTGHFRDDVFADLLIKFNLGVNLDLYDDKRKNDKENMTEDEQELKFSLFKDQVVVDLCAGDTVLGYLYALLHGAKGYIGVDKYASDNLRGNLEKIKHYLLDTYNSTIKHNFDLNDIDISQLKMIPAAVIDDDALSFLERLPNESVSFLSSGTVYLIDDKKYIKQCREEIMRALNQNGTAVANDSAFDLSSEEDIKTINACDIKISKKVPKK